MQLLSNDGTGEDPGRRGETAAQTLDRYDRLVRALARRLLPLARVGRALDEEDLHAEGRVAVLEAVATYRSYGIQESTWVRTRIRQRMIDAIRRLDPRTREEMRLVVRHARGQTEGDEAERGRALHARQVVSVHATAEGSDALLDTLRDEALPADEVIGARRRHERLQVALEGLPKRQRTALTLGLYEGLQLREIGERMGISESRVCQLQKKAVSRLNGQLGHAA